MKIKSAKSFRLWYRTKVKEIEKDSPNHNENFVGTYHTENGKKIKGFFEMYHGDKSDIAGFLPSLLDIAEDGQAIFEFLQNAVDCGSTHFYIFYSKKYFLAINNGQPFSNEDLKGILNIGQGTKLNQDCDKIGRFGIGFKLVHRLVGRTAGVEELTQEYKGPILFSWHKPEQIKFLRLSSSVESVDYLGNSENQNLPWLLKILLTNFPAEPTELIKNLSYQDKVLFPQEELDELHLFLKDSFSKHENSISFDNLKEGSLFFIKLGQKKHKLLEKDYLDLRQGIQYSMNMLKSLQHIYINDDNIPKEKLETELFEISKDSQEFKTIDPIYKACNIKIVFGFFADYKEGIRKKIKEAPSFYKYFPMGDETNGFSFIIHSDGFSIEANRRKQHQDKINMALFPEIAKFIIGTLDNYKETNRNRFLQIYVCLLLSDIPNKQNNEWLRSIFYDNLLYYLRSNIPTKNNQFSAEPKNVKINNLKINLNLPDFGLDHIQWFEWESDNDSELVKEAKEKGKLSLEIWNLEDLILDGSNVKINSWLQSIAQEKFDEFVYELRNISETSWERKEKRLFRKFCQIQYFKFSNGDFLSINEHKKYSNALILNPQLYEIKDILLELGFIVSDRVVTNGDKASYLARLIHSEVDYLKNDVKLFEIISLKLSENKLKISQKQRLFVFFEKSEGVETAKLRNLVLFCNNEDEIKPLCQLVDSSLNTPVWINPFKIKAEENFAGLKKYLLSEKALYQKVILPNWDDITSEVIDITDFYQKVKYYYDQDEKNTPLKKQAFVFVNEYEGFVPASDVFYNAKFLQVGNYQNFQSAVYSLTDTQIPQKQIFNYLKEAPFEVKNSNLLDLSINNDTELNLDEVKAILAFCKRNNENFFQKCTIEKQDKIYCISSKTKGVFQVFPSKEARSFIENNLDDTFKILPYELDDYKDEVGILYREPFYNQLIESVDVDDYKTELIDILAYDDPKRKFLFQLSEVRFVAGEQYDKESFEYKILNFACDSKILKEADYPKFREKIILETSEQDLTLSEIPPFADKIKIKGYELSLAKILPNTYPNSNFLSELLAYFIGLGLAKERLNTIFGISQEIDLEDIFEIFSEQTETLENSEQLAFAILYNQHIENVDSSGFKVETLGNAYNLYEYNFYTRAYSFLVLGATLNEKYKQIEKIFKDFPVSISESNKTELLKQPYFSESEFICPDIDDEMSDEQKLSLIEFLFNQWDKKNKKTAIRNIDWTNINETETEKLLGFDPSYSVYPSKYALESEELPEYLQEWLGEDNTKINFIADLGVFTESSILLALRKYFNNEGTFNKSKIAQDSRFSDEEMLFNTFEWLKSKELELNSKEEFEVLEEMVRVINSNRTKGQELIIQNEYDFELLESEATEWETAYYENWKEYLEYKFSIYLFEGALPKIIKLDEIDDYVFYRFAQGDIAIDDENRIFINHNIDIKKGLSALISGKNDFTAEYLLSLYQTKETVQTGNDEVAELKNEVERLRQIIESLTRVSGTATYHATVSFDIEYHNEIKEKSEEYLFNLLKKKYSSKTIKWLNYNERSKQFEESWENHDFEILNKNGTVLHYIDCKGTPQQKSTFYLTSNEWDFFLDCVQNGKSYQIYRIFNVEGNTGYVHIDNLWEWIKTGKVVPYLSATETIKGGRVFLTLTQILC